MRNHGRESVECLKAAFEAADIAIKGFACNDADTASVDWMIDLVLPYHVGICPLSGDCWLVEEEKNDEGDPVFRFYFELDRAELIVAHLEGLL